MNTIKEFVEEYDDHGLMFNSLQYRKGARITAPFGLTDGYRIVDNRYVWDSIRLHTGVDRSYHNRKDENIIISPFNFERSKYIDYGKDHVYGSVLRLFNDKYRFEMRIIHIRPDEINKEIINKPIPKDTIIGKAGDYGNSSTARHTHTEIISYDERNEVFESILKIKYGNTDVKSPYRDEEILDAYRRTDYWKDRPDMDIFEHYNSILIQRKTKDGFFNRYKYTYMDWYYGYGTKEKPEWHTRYSSELLFNGL